MSKVTEALGYLFAVDFVKKEYEKELQIAARLSGLPKDARPTVLERTLQATAVITLRRAAHMVEYPFVVVGRLSGLHGLYKAASRLKGRGQRPQR